MQKIMFNDKYGLTKAVLEGRKTQTRRVIEKRLMDKIQSFQEDYFNATLDCLKGKELIEAYFLNYPKKLPYKVGEIVAVAQCYCAITEDLRVHQCIMLAETSGWTNKMFVKAELMPHQIRITNVRIERLQDISNEDCLKEGIEKFDTFGEPASYIFCDSEKFAVYPKGWCTSPREAYAELIDKVSGKGTWESNPYVFIYDFELVR